MKEKYEELDLEIMTFDRMDIITSSQCPDYTPDDWEPGEMA